MKKKRLLLVDDDQSLRRVLQVQLEQDGYAVTSAASAVETLSLLAVRPYDLVIADLKMPGMSGLELLKTIRSKHPETIVVILTAFGTVETAVEAMKAGAYHYLTKPVHPEELALTLDRALEHLQLMEEVRSLRASLNQKYGFENILGRSDALMEVLDTAARAARTNSTLLIRGETGTGKELLARAIHFNSSRKDYPLITINCGAIPKDLIESELFGHVKGSFTGAISNKRGKVEMADGGTLFLDEVGELSPDVQVKLLRLIQEGEIEKVGSEERAKLDLRIIAATHRDLQAMVEDGTFRQDLYYRLAVIPLMLPPLRERSDDIPDLVQFFFNQSKQKNGRPELSLSDAVMPYFSQYRWPGNVRELENLIERIVVLARGNDVTVQDLPEVLRRERSQIDALEIGLPPQGISLEAIEKELILKALHKCGWNQTHAARYLDISRKTLIYRMEKHGIEKPAERYVPQFSQ
jgi:two-component system NtrC family response regulator